jgi:hypothetical protein
VSDWKQLYAEVSELAPPARLGHRINQLAVMAPAHTRASRVWVAARRNRGRVAELAAALIAIAVLVVAIHGHDGSGQPPTGGAGPSTHRVGAHGVSLALPPDFHVVKPASPGAVSDPQTLIVVGTHGVHAIRSRCQIASYHVPSQGAVIVIIRWQSSLDAGGSGGPGIAALRKLRRVEQPSFECYSGRGAAVQFRAGGHPYQVNVMVGDHATAARIAQALAVARSLHVLHAATPLSARAQPLHLILPVGWTSRSFSGGLGSDPHGLRVLVAANRRLPASVAECESLIPGLTSDQAMVRIYDYGQSPLAPKARSVNVIRPGAPNPVQQPNGRVGGFNETRVRYEGHTLVIDTNYGSSQPTAGVRAQVTKLLRGVITTR